VIPALRASAAYSRYLCVDQFVELRWPHRGHLNAQCGVAAPSVGHLEHCQDRAVSLSMVERGVRRAVNPGDPRQVLTRIEGKLRVERRDNCIRRRHHEQRVSVGRRFRNDLSARRTARARSVVHDNLALRLT
jgi:hypothetical protein